MRTDSEPPFLRQAMQGPWPPCWGDWPRSNQLPCDTRPRCSVVYGKAGGLGWRRDNPGCKAPVTGHGGDPCGLAKAVGC